MADVVEKILAASLYFLMSAFAPSLGGEAGEIELENELQTYFNAMSDLKISDTDYRIASCNLFGFVEHKPVCDEDDEPYTIRSSGFVINFAELVAPVVVRPSMIDTDKQFVYLEFLPQVAAEISRQQMEFSELMMIYPDDVETRLTKFSEQLLRSLPNSLTKSRETTNFCKMEQTTLPSNPRAFPFSISEDTDALERSLNEYIALCSN